MKRTNQFSPQMLNLIEEAKGRFGNPTTVTVHNEIPDTTIIPISSPNHWIKIPNVICVFVDMKGSTVLSVENNDKNTSRAYQLFTDTAVRIFHEMDAPYIDVRGDGCFALFNQTQVHRALTAAIHFKTFASEIAIPAINNLCNTKIGFHGGVDMKSVLVRKIGMKRSNGRTDRQNEVWAGKPVNTASKLASLAGDGALLVSDRFYNKIKSQELKISCGCNSNGKPINLWKQIDVKGQKNFDFNIAYSLSSNWCIKHGLEYSNKALMADSNKLK